MSANTLNVLWTVTPLTAPQPHLACNRCGTTRPYRSSGKFRLNANGKRLDAWLVYRCTSCENSWNFPVFERRLRRGVTPDLLAALQTNDPALARRHEFDAAALRRATRMVEEFPDVVVRKAILGTAGAGAAGALSVALALERPICLRLDRLLASELGVSRSRLDRWAESGTLETDAPDLRKPLRHDCMVRLILSNEPDRVELAARAVGEIAV